MRLGVVILPELRWADAKRQWRQAEAMGFAHVWTYDHLAWRMLRDAPWFGAMPLLAAVAAVTERIRIGPLVASPNFRHPVPFAKEVTSVDDISGGRLIVGVGAGGGGWDATMLGNRAWPAQERADRFQEFVELLDVVLREPAASWRGTYYSADEARTYPGCVQQPRVPFAVAATGPRGMRLAARFAATWVTTGDRSGAGAADAAAGSKILRDQMSRLDDACVQEGRDPRTLERLVLTGPALDGGLASPEAFEEACGRYSEVGVTDLVVHWPRPDEPYATDPDVFERIFGG